MHISEQNEKANAMTDAKATALAGVINIITTAYEDTQAIYLYGTWGSEYQRADSDIDIAVLLSHAVAKKIEQDPSQWWTLTAAVASKAGTEMADVLNLRVMPVILCKEIIAAE